MFSKYKNRELAHQASIHIKFKVYSSLIKLSHFVFQSWLTWCPSALFALVLFCCGVALTAECYLTNEKRKFHKHNLYILHCNVSYCTHLQSQWQAFVLVFWLTWLLVLFLCRANSLKGFRGKYTQPKIISGPFRELRDSCKLFKVKGANCWAKWFPGKSHKLFPLGCFHFNGSSWQIKIRLCGDARVLSFPLDK